ncbi:MAG TPA: hypothetical protein VIL46_07450 [Gemmataceae bacterium]
MADEAGREREDEVPEGAAVFPEIPEELGVHPLLLAALHAVVFLEGSDRAAVHPAAAAEALDHIFGYLRRLKGADLRRAREDIETLVGFARHEKWPKGQVQFLKSFLADAGVGTEGTS